MRQPRLRLRTVMIVAAAVAMPLPGWIAASRRMPDEMERRDGKRRTHIDRKIRLSDQVSSIQGFEGGVMVLLKCRHTGR